MKKNPKKLISWRATAGECKMVNQLREKLGRNSESDLLRHLVAEAHHALFFVENMTNANGIKVFSATTFSPVPVASGEPRKEHPQETKEE